MKNYLTLTTDGKHILVISLRLMREKLKKDAKVRKIRKTAKRKKKVVVFNNPQLEKIFHQIPELQDYIKG